MFQTLYAANGQWDTKRPWFRNIDKLPVSPEVKSRLKSFMGLKNEIDIAEWHNFVKSVPDKSVQGEH